MARSAFLSDVPHRIETYKRAYARDIPIAPEKFWLWDYACFLENLLREVNRRVGDGQTLAEDHIRSIAAFADVETLASTRYVYPLWRGASGYDTTHARNVVGRYEGVLRGLAPAMGRALSVYHTGEKDWDDVASKAWLERFDAATKLHAFYGDRPNKAPEPTTTSVTSPAIVR